MRQLGVTERTNDLRRKEYCRMKVALARRLKELERENTRVERLLAVARRGSGL